jgi:hypothetical protein
MASARIGAGYTWGCHHHTPVMDTAKMAELSQKTTKRAENQKTADNEVIESQTSDEQDSSRRAMVYVVFGVVILAAVAWVVYQNYFQY